MQRYGQRIRRNSARDKAAAQVAFAAIASWRAAVDKLVSRMKSLDRRWDGFAAGYSSPGRARAAIPRLEALLSDVAQLASAASSLASVQLSDGTRRTLLSFDPSPAAHNLGVVLRVASELRADIQRRLDEARRIGGSDQSAAVGLDIAGLRREVAELAQLARTIETLDTASLADVGKRAARLRTAARKAGRTALAEARDQLSTIASEAMSIENSVIAAELRAHSRRAGSGR